jgi:hypothetical protein
MNNQTALPQTPIAQDPISLWLNRLLPHIKRMSTDEEYRQEIAKKLS